MKNSLSARDVWSALVMAESGMILVDEGWVKNSFCPLIKGLYRQEVKEVLGSMPRSLWSQITTGWCFLIHGRSLFSMKPMEKG